ncbi:MAG: extracellular solute-binding protein [Ruthenibacterium sp.]
MKRFTGILLTMLLAAGLLSGCGGADNKVVIYSSAEEFRNTHVTERLAEQFPDYKIDLQYISTGNSGAKLKAEGKNTECDIVLGLEAGYLQQNSDILADLSAYDTSVYLDDTVPANHKYLPWERGGGCIVVRTDLLKEKGLAEPTCYDDLLKPEYKGLISMPSPKASGTGYAFVKSLVNAWGEEKALAYFDKLSENILQYTSSGSGPVNALVQGEAVIGLGMTFQSVEEINKGIPLKILFFAEGSPNTICGVAMIDGKEKKEAVKAVFDFLNSTLVYEDKELYLPEQIFKVQENTIANYPKDIPYADMTSKDAVGEKEALLAKWTH